MGSKLLKGVKEPRTVYRYIRNRTPNILNKCHDLNHYLHRNTLNKSGIDIIAEDWDNIIILDACRYDMFVDAINWDGKIKKAISSGSSTREFIETTFIGRDFPDTVYVSANPQLDRFEVTDNFHKYYRLYENHWDNDLRTVQPDAVAEVALKAEASHPNKRLIIHYVQPHYPFIGELGQEIDHRGFTQLGKFERKTDDVWSHLKNGNIDEDSVWKAYNENLKIALPSVERLINNLDGKTVVTSDHGNVLGRWGVYGHPTYRYLKELVEVPWFEASHSERKEIIKGSLSDETSEEIDIVNERLEALGYQTDQS